MGHKHIAWEDDWIFKHIASSGSYKELTHLYNETFHTNVSLSAIKNHCRFMLGIQKPRKNNRHYTNEQIQFLRENYEQMSNRELLVLFNEKFNETRTLSSMKNFGHLYNVQVDKDVRKKNRRDRLDQEGSKRATRKSGDIRIECGRPVMKDNNGNWKTAARAVYEKINGPVPKGYAVTVLDGNVFNTDIKNLACIPWSYLGLLQRHNLRSEHPEITRTGIKWCELKVALDKYEKMEEHNEH